jgi:GTP-binding protein HflX
MEEDFLELIESLEAEFARKRRPVSREDSRERAILISVTTGSIADAEESLSELAELARTANVVVLDSVVQRRARLDPRTLVGSGKLKQLLIHAMQLLAHPGQGRQRRH